MPFKIKMGKTEKIFELLLRAPKMSPASLEIEPYILGKANLFFPLFDVEVKMASTGSEYSLKSVITLQQVGELNKKTGQRETRPSRFKLNYIATPVVPGLNIVFVNEREYSVQNEKGEEIYSIVQLYIGGNIIISAGADKISSPPPKPIITQVELQKELEIFSSVIEALVTSVYEHQKETCLKNFGEPWATDLYTKLTERNIYLYLRGPLSIDDKFKKNSEDEDEDENENERKMQDKNFVGKAPKPIDPKKLEYYLADVGGIEEQKRIAWQVVEFLKEPEKFNRLGAKIPKGVLLEGPPGTGKTMLAKAIAKEADVPFFAIKGSDFVEVYVGVGAARVRMLFKTAAQYAKKKKTSVIIFFDEIDAVAGKREGGSGGSQEREQTLNEMLGQLDGFEANNKIVVIAATNRPDILDPAITRPGRFNRRIILPNPDLDAREAILKIHARNKIIKEGIDFKQIARTIIGFSGADIDDLLNEAAILAASKDKDAVDEEDINEARERIMLGPERKIKDMPEYERKNTAYHEAGHTLLHEHFYPLTDPVQKVTIVPRGQALGLTVPQPIEDKYNSNKAQILKKMCALMGGRAAEIILSGEKNYTTSASKDIEMATELAQKMVRRWGMSRELGPVNLGGTDTHMYLGYQTGNSSGISPQTQEKIDAVVKDLCEKSLKRAIKVLTEQRKALDALANALLEKETLSHDDIEQIMKKNTVKRDHVFSTTARMGFFRSGE